MRATIIHGPNLNLLGSREPEVYGSSTLEEVNELIRVEAREIGWEVDVHQSAREGEIIELLHAAVGRSDGALVNPAAYAHTSRAIAEAMRAVPYPVIEVHLSNIHAREPWRRRSVTAEAAVGLIAGFGPSSYALGLRALERLLA
jgi:3-dehydroquinate dehydratase II